MSTITATSALLTLRVAEARKLNPQIRPHGAVVGGGLELASTCHIRMADESAFYALPEGSHGIFVDGGGSARIPNWWASHA